ncbi:MAG: thioredoxin [Bacteroidetes bacterium]|nr:MAG: thioredoxin [Bacteroidota bacterium]
MKGNFQKIINSDKPVLVDFYADWCGPCKMQAPILKEAASELNGQARIIKIDVDKNRKVSEQYQIQSIPTLILFKNGQPVWRQSGLLSKQQLLDVIRQHV